MARAAVRVARQGQSGLSYAHRGSSTNARVYASMAVVICSCMNIQAERACNLRHATSNIQHAACDGRVGRGYSTPAFSAVACNMQLATCNRYHATCNMVQRGGMRYSDANALNAKWKVRHATRQHARSVQSCKGNCQLPPALAQTSATAQDHAATRARTRMHAPRASAVDCMEHENDFARLHECG